MDITNQVKVIRNRPVDPATAPIGGGVNLKGSAALNYLLSNPNAQARINANNTGLDLGVLRSQAATKLKQQQDQAAYDQKVKERGILGTGWLGDIIYNVGKSATALPRYLASTAGNSTGIDAALAKLTPEQRAQYDNSFQGQLYNAGRNITKGLLDTEEQKRLKNEGQLGFGLQSTANTASFALPIGGQGAGLAKTVIGGAGVGGIQSLANQDLSKGVDTNNLVTSLILGGGTAGAFKLGGDLLGRLGNKGNVAQDVAQGANKNANVFERSNLNIKPEASPLGLQGAEQLGNEASQYITNRGFNVTAKNVGGAYQKAIGELDNVLANSTNKVPINSAFDKFTESLANEGIDAASGQARTAANQWMTKLSKLGSEADASEVALLKRELDNTLTPVYNKIAKGNPLNEAEQVRLSLRQSLDEALKEAVPEAAPLYRELSVYNQVAGGANKAAQSNISAPFLLQGIKVPAGGVIQSARGTLGNVVRNGISIPSIPGASTLGNLLSSPFATAPAIAGTAPRQSFDIAKGASLGQDDVSTILNNYISGKQAEASNQALTNPQQQSGPDKQAILLQALQLTRSPSKPNGDITQAIALANFLGPDKGSSGKLLPATQLEKLSASNTSLQGLTDLEKMIQSNGSYFGPVQGGALGDLANSLGLSPERAAIRTQINTLAQNLGKALEGGKLTDQDIERYRTMLPQLSDPPQIALAKLQQVKSMVQNGIQGINQTYTTGGYSVDANQ